MNSHERSKLAADNLRLYFDTMSKKHIGCVAINTHSTIEHEKTKFELAYHLKKEGNIISTELVTKKGKRPDLVILDVTPPICYEIQHSETNESIQKKKLDYYPLRIIVVTVSKTHAVMLEPKMEKSL